MNDKDIYELKDHEPPSGPFGMELQGCHSSVLLIVEPGAKNRSNAGKVKAQDVLNYFKRNPSTITNHFLSNMPIVNPETGEITNENGAPKGLCKVARAACRMARQLKMVSNPRQWYGVKTVRMGQWYVGMVDLELCADHDQTWGYLERLGIEKHSRIFEVRLPRNYVWNWDYVFEFPSEDEE